MKSVSLIVVLACSTALTACTGLGAGESGFSDYALVRVQRVRVGDGQMSVVPPRNYNRHRRMLFSDVRDVEDWTLNGPILDGISFISGMKNNRELIRSAARQTSKCRVSCQT